MNTPILETDRLILRPFQEEDAESVFECWECDPDVAKYMFWTSHNDIEKTKEWIAFELGQIEKEDWYRFAIVLKETNELIGTALIYFEEEVECWEIGYNLGKEYWGKGYATDGFFKLNVMTIINKENKSSAYFLKSFNVWHSRLGHVNYDTICRLINLDHIPSFQIDLK